MIQKKGMCFVVGMCQMSNVLLVLMAWEVCIHFTLWNNTWIEAASIHWALRTPHKPRAYKINTKSWNEARRHRQPTCVGRQGGDRLLRLVSWRRQQNFWLRDEIQSLRLTSSTDTYTSHTYISITSSHLMVSQHGLMESFLLPCISKNLSSRKSL
jgi:hypothetical protein